jgi:hypothetical protein
LFQCIKARPQFQAGNAAENGRRQAWARRKRVKSDTAHPM